MDNTQANKPATGKVGIARLLTVERRCPGLPEPGRWAAQSDGFLTADFADNADAFYPRHP